MDPDRISEHFEFDRILPPGRLNGFVNMIRLIQTQVKAELQRFYLVESNSSTVNVMESEERIIIKDNRNNEVAVLLSGGVDSSVALKLLQLQGLKA